MGREAGSAEFAAGKGDRAVTMQRVEARITRSEKNFMNVPLG